MRRRPQRGLLCVCEIFAKVRFKLKLLLCCCLLLVISGVVNVTNREIRSVTQGADVYTSQHPTSYSRYTCSLLQAFVLVSNGKKNKYLKLLINYLCTSIQNTMNKQIIFSETFLIFTSKNYQLFIFIFPFWPISHILQMNPICDMI